jgi:hypothetical protein
LPLAGVNEPPEVVEVKRGSGEEGEQAQGPDPRPCPQQQGEATHEQEADRAIVLETPDPFYSVSRFYGEFPQVETEIAIACLQAQTEWLSEQ